MVRQSCRQVGSAAAAVVLVAMAAWCLCLRPLDGGVLHASPSHGVVLVGWSIGGITGGGYEEITLVGTWSSASGWRNAKAQDLIKLLPQGGEWTLYGIGHSPVAAVTDPPRVTGGSGRRQRVAARLRSDVSITPGAWLALSGSRRVDRRLVRSLRTVEERATEIVSAQLRQRGLWQYPEAAICQNIVVDLNGDGRLDRLITVYAGLEMSKTGPVDLVAAAIATEDGGFRVAVLTQDAWDELRRASSFLGARVIAVGDTNGDGRCEIGIRLLGNDYSGLEVYSVDGTRVRKVLQTGG